VNLYKAGTSRIHEEIPMFSGSDGASSDQLDYNMRKTTLTSGPHWQRHNRRREGGGLAPGPSSAGLAHVRGNKAQRREKRAKRPPTWAAEQTRSQGKEKALSQRWSWPNRAEKRGVSLFISSFGYAYFFPIPF
jgi:hypothetical protein